MKRPEKKKINSGFPFFLTNLLTLNALEKRIHYLPIGFLRRERQSFGGEIDG